MERGAGIGSAYLDIEYEQAGARIVSAKEAWAAQLVVKVKEPLNSEYNYLQGQLLFTFLHLAGVEKELTYRLLESGTTAIAYETLENRQGDLPLLAPLSAIAGNMAALVGSYYLAKFNHGNGVQLGSVLGKRHGKVLVIGDGVVGFHAARALNSMGANVFQAGLTNSKVGLQKTGELKGIEYLYSEKKTIAKNCLDADLVIGAVLNKGAKAPYVVTEEMVKSMCKGAVVVDVSIDQGGCIETSRATTHDNPIYEQYGVIHYCVANMPGAYPRTATIALCSETLIYIQQLAETGVSAFHLQEISAKAINIYKSRITNKQVATSLNLLESYTPINEIWA
ncbi:alanine dehydrogenase [Bathymodiolus platifrons methanotrophic gill symbiont]|nr:alanine dehydrogenase [Bathymodiolus platifrons methanotrophic gill symbiont]GFO74621.1 alanine dehydrogenase [Bathymodiolus platifrons methanotrophic gill symbiont]